MQKLIFVLAVALAACGGSKTTTTPTDMATKPDDFSAVSHDLAIETHDFAVKKGDAGVGTMAEVTAACMNICGCFTNANAKATCQTVCVQDDSRYQTSFSVTTSGKLNSYSGSFSYGELFTSAGAFSGGSGSFSTSGSLPAPTLVPTSACLTCLATATCSSLEQGTACSTVCPYVADE